jgi:hypothetical protein
LHEILSLSLGLLPILLKAPRKIAMFEIRVSNKSIISSQMKKSKFIERQIVKILGEQEYYGVFS